MWSTTENAPPQCRKAVHGHEMRPLYGDNERHVNVTCRETSCRDSHLRHFTFFLRDHARLHQRSSELFYKTGRCHAVFHLFRASSPFRAGQCNKNF
ncbi:hypothetical protein CEXT_9481 [Caerostris extrusa]|uniref:Uncharacterized protein n=1 Tax=Caerostris extrusa TaxID=172846 RepID=A0AAV4NXX7_CAEEX|nr:hypothetical protein CEXT_9481 [Caerostris extrusa]